MTLDLTKPVQWCGRPAEVLCTDLFGAFPIAARVIDHAGNKSVMRFTVEGYFTHDPTSEMNLTNVPERIDRWFIVGPTMGFASREEAEQYTRETPHYAIIPLAFEDGELVGGAGA